MLFFVFSSSRFRFLVIFFSYFLSSVYLIQAVGVPKVIRGGVEVIASIPCLNVWRIFPLLHLCCTVLCCATGIVYRVLAMWGFGLLKCWGKKG